MKTLNQLGIKYGCDKSDIHHTFKGQTYLDVYETYFEKFKNSPIKFLELGVRQGQSISMWRDYFENAKVIVGLDISPECKVFEQGNIKIEIGSQADPMIIKNIIQKYGPFDIILDDASHINDLSIASFNFLKNSVVEGGYYIIEDLRNSYENLTVDVKSWPGMHLNTGISFDNSSTRKDLNNLLLQIVKELDYRTSEFQFVNFHSQMVILGK